MRGGGKKREMKKKGGTLSWITFRSKQGKHIIPEEELILRERGNTG